MKKFLSVVLAVAMMFALAVSASAKDVGTEASFFDSMRDANETHIKLTSDIRANFYPSDNKEIDLNGHVLTMGDASVSGGNILIIKNGVIQGENLRKMLDISRVNYVVFDNVTIKNAIFKIETTALILNNVTFDTAQFVVYKARQISYDSDKTKNSAIIDKYQNSNNSLAENILNTNGGSFGLDDNGKLAVSFGNLELYKIMVGGREKEDLVTAISDARHDKVELLWKNNDNITLKQGDNEETLSIPVVPGTLNPKSIPMPTIEKAGYCFAGWYDSKGNKLSKDSVITTAATYEIKWVPEQDVLSDLSKTMTNLGFSQSRIDQVTSLFSSNNLTGSMFIGNGNPDKNTFIPIPYSASMFNGPQATIATAIVIAAIGIAAGVYCVKGNKEEG